jgi:hypothetical protein
MVENTEVRGRSRSGIRGPVVLVVSLHAGSGCYRYLFQRSNSSLKCIIWPVGAVIIAHFRPHSRRFSPFSSRPENTGNSQAP